MKMEPARPRAAVGQTVDYFDRHRRMQRGAIIHIKAMWTSSLGGWRQPRITYCVEHPTYANRRHYTSDVIPTK